MTKTLLETRVFEGLNLRQINLPVALIGAFLWACTWHLVNSYNSVVSIGLCFMVIVDLVVFYKRNPRIDGITDCSKALAEVHADESINEL